MIRVYLAQLNTIVGDIEGNLARSLEALSRAKAARADLLILPEQTLPGYPAKDLLMQRDFIRRSEQAVERFAEATAGAPAALVGFPKSYEFNSDLYPRGCAQQVKVGKLLYNSAAFCRAGHVETVYNKCLLPTYDVFDESRYFDASHDFAVVEINGHRCALTICEDLWNDDLYWSNRLYDFDPVNKAVVTGGANVILSLSASPFALGKRRVRRGMFAALAKRYKAPVLVNNLVGANDDLIFDGVSMVFDQEGNQVAQGKSFAEDDLIVEITPTAVKNCGASAVDEPEMEELRRGLVLGIRDYVGKCGFKQVLIGLSGGIDSALVAALAAEALGPANVHGVAMPSRYSSDHSKSDAEALAKNLGIHFSMIPIEGMFATAQAELGSNLAGAHVPIALENMQSRLRGLTLMSLSNAGGAMVLATGNKSELSVGYCTLYGDMCGGLAVIGDVPKTMVYDLCRHLNQSAGRPLIPESTMTKPPSAELRPDQKDTDSLPPYEVLDPIIRGYAEEALEAGELIARGHDEATVRRVIRMIQLNEYKRRQAPPVLKVTSRAFGYGWRMPIARGRS